MQYRAADDLTNDDIRLIIEFGELIYKAAKKYDQWLDKVILDKICIKNDYSKPIYVAIHFMFDKNWITKAWFKFDPGETANILSLRLDSRFVYLHAHCYDGSRWGKGDYNEKIEGVIREFTQVDVGLIRRKFTYRFHE